MPSPSSPPPPAPSPPNSYPLPPTAPPHTSIGYTKRISIIVPLHEVANSAAVPPTPPLPPVSQHLHLPPPPPPSASALAIPLPVPPQLPTGLRALHNQSRLLPARKNKRLRAPLACKNSNTDQTSAPHLTSSLAHTIQPVPAPIATVPSSQRNQAHPSFHLPVGDRDLQAGKTRGKSPISLPAPLRNQILSAKRPKSGSVIARREEDNKTYTTSTKSTRKKEEDIVVLESRPNLLSTNNNNNILTTGTSATNHQPHPYPSRPTTPHHPELAAEASDSNRPSKSIPSLGPDFSDKAIPASTSNSNIPVTATVTSNPADNPETSYNRSSKVDPSIILHQSHYDRTPYLTTAKKRKSLRSTSPPTNKRSLRGSPVEQASASQIAQGHSQGAVPRRGLRGVIDSDAKVNSGMGRRTRHQNPLNSTMGSVPSSQSNGSDPAAGATNVPTEGGRKRRLETAVSPASGSDSEGAATDGRKKKRRMNNNNNGTVNNSSKHTSASTSKVNKAHVPTNNNAEPSVSALPSAIGDVETDPSEVDVSKATLLKLAPMARDREIFWVKIKGHPYWPAQMVKLTEELEGEPRFQKAMRFRRRSEASCVMYFGTCEVAYVNKERSCIAWDEGLRRGIVDVVDRIKPHFRAALVEVVDFCSLSRRHPRGWWNEPDVLRLANGLHTAHNSLRGISKSCSEMADRECVVWAKIRSKTYWPVQIIPNNVAIELSPDIKVELIEIPPPVPHGKKSKVGSTAGAGDSNRVKGSKAGTNAGGGGESSSSSSVSDFGATSRSLPCMFFGTAEVVLVSEKHIVPFRAGLTRGYMNQNDKHEFHVALGEAWGYIQDPRIWPSGYISRKTWWNYKPDVKGPGRRKKRDFNANAEGSNGSLSSGHRGSHSSSSSLESSLPDLSLLPEYEHIKKSVWVDGVEPPSKVKKGDITCCECKFMGNAPVPNNGNGGGRKEKDSKRKGIPCCHDSSCLNFASNFLCSGACPTKKGCRNVSFHRRRLPKMKPFFTPDQRGWGMRVEEFLPKGSFVIEYVGEIISRDILDERLNQMDKDNSTEYYMMDLTNDLLVDAKRKGNYSRFINSSCEPNCQTQKWTDPVTEQTHVGIFAIQDIQPGTELTYNYCFEDFGLAGKRGKRSFQCMCGTPSCMMLEEIERDMLKKLLKKRVLVRWDEGWYSGVVEQYFPQRKRFRVQYDDGDCEDLVLGNPLADKDDHVAYRLEEDEISHDVDVGSDGEEQKQGPGRRKKNGGSSQNSQDMVGHSGHHTSQSHDVIASKHKAKDGETRKKGRK